MEERRNELIPWLLVHKATIPTERTSLVVEVSANFCEWRGGAWSAQQIHMAGKLVFSRTESIFTVSFKINLNYVQHLIKILCAHRSIMK
jgi:hypothetical protein